MKKLIVKVVSVAVVTILFGISGNSFATPHEGDSDTRFTRRSIVSSVDELIQFLGNWNFGNGSSSATTTSSSTDEQKFKEGKEELINSLKVITNYQTELEKCFRKRGEGDSSEDSDKTSEEIFNEALNESMSFLKKLFEEKDGMTSKEVVKALKSFIEAKNEKVKSKQDTKLLRALTEMDSTISKLVESRQLLDASNGTSRSNFQRIERKIKNAINELQEEDSQSLCFSKKKARERDGSSTGSSGSDSGSSSGSGSGSATPTNSEKLPEIINPQPTPSPEPQPKQTKEDPTLDELLKLLSQLNKPTKVKDPNEEELKKIKDMLDPLKKMLEEMAKKEPNKKEDENPLKDLAKALEPKKDKGGEKGGVSPSGGGTPSGGGGDKGGNEPKLPEPQKEDEEEPMPQQQGGFPMLPGIPSGSSQPIPMKDDRKFSDDLDSRPKQVAAPTDDKARGLLELVRLQQQLLMAAQQSAQAGGVNTVASKFQGTTRRAPVRPYRYGTNGVGTQVKSGIPQGARTIPSALQSAK